MMFLPTLFSSVSITMSTRLQKRVIGLLEMMILMKKTGELLELLEFLNGVHDENLKVVCKHLTCVGKFLEMMRMLRLKLLFV